MRQAERYEILEQLKQKQFNREEIEIGWQLFIRKIVYYLIVHKTKNQLNRLSKRVKY